MELGIKDKLIHIKFRLTFHECITTTNNNLKQ